MNLIPCVNRPLLNPCTLKGLEYQIDPYIGCEHLCFYCYALIQAETDWSKEILFHEDLIGRLESELSGISPQTIYMGWQTDPYQPCEAKKRQTRGVLELLLEKGFSASILTKSDLVLRDLDLLTDMKHANVSVSVAFNNDEVRKLFESKTIDTVKRVYALKKLKAAGVSTSALICPVIPYITDVKPLIDMLASHAGKIWIYSLSMLHKSDPNWLNVKGILQSHFPGLEEKIETALFTENHFFWAELERDLLGLQNDGSLNLSIHL
jgi:DNA repair photolyase